MVSKYSFSWIFVTRDSAYINWSFKSLSWKFRTDCYLYRENCKKFKIRYAFRFSGQFEFSPIFSNLFSNRKLKLIILTLGPLDCIKISKAQYQSNIKYHQYHNLVRWIIRLSRKKKKHNFFKISFFFWIVRFSSHYSWKWKSQKAYECHCLWNMSCIIFIFWKISLARKRYCSSKLSASSEFPYVTTQKKLGIV